MTARGAKSSELWARSHAGAASLHWRRHGAGSSRRQETVPPSGWLVLLDLSVDLVTMGAHIAPGVRQVLSTQLRIRSKELRFRRAAPTRVLKEPHRDAGPHDARSAAAHTGCTLDAWVCVTEILSDPSKKLGLFGPAQAGQQPLDLAFVSHTSRWCHTFAPAAIRRQHGAKRQDWPIEIGPQLALYRHTILARIGP